MSDLSHLLETQGVEEDAGSEEDDLMEMVMIPQPVIGAHNVSVDQSPLQPQLQKNKESLEKKLLARRPMTTLVEQGIVPEYKTSPSLHFQRTKLERAKTGDLLKSKISHRPERTELVHRHILEDVRPDVDPSLCDRQRQLKRAKLADSLANQLSHRPGPLELIQKNILHTDETVETALKEGTLQFRPTADGHVTSRHVTTLPQTFDEDSSDTAPSPQVDTCVSSPLATDTCVASPLARDTSSPNVSALLAQFSDITNSNRSFRSESLGDITSVRLKTDHEDLIKADIFGGSGGNLARIGASSVSHDVFSAPNQHRDAPGKERKKLKAKKPGTAPKPTTFKFHEYKGPPESLKRKKHEKKKEKSAHDLLLEQQQLLLQWQVENKNKFPLLLPAPAKLESGRISNISIGTSSTSGYLSGASSSCASSLVTSPTSSVPGTPRSATPRESTPTRFNALTPQDVNNATSLLHKLDAMKVNDLKSELKKRNLPSSGSKPALIEKLKPALEAVIAAGKMQFKQPYKQIEIKPGGLIILKPSPNSQLLTETKDMSQDVAMSPANGHESTPEQDDRLQRTLTPLMLPRDLGSELLGLLSPSDSVHSLSTNSEIENILSERRDSLHSVHSNNDSDFSFNLMEIQEQQMPPPAPPPPPPPQSNNKSIKDPLPLPTPPSAHSVHGAVSHQQFLPPTRTSQQIEMAKAALEAQRTPSDYNHSSRTARPGPKGQFVWPPVSSSQNPLITIRAVSDDQAPVRNETRPVSVSQLAAVFSQTPSTSSSPLPIFVKLPQEPVPPDELGPYISVNNGNNLPATLPVGPNNTNMLISDNPPGDTNQDIIAAQQRRILELERALESKQELSTCTSTPTINNIQEVQPNLASTKHLLQQQINNKHNMNNSAKHVDDVIDSFFQTEELPESVQNFGVKVPERPPSPPPQPNKSPPIEFPSMDLTETLPFDFDIDAMTGILSNGTTMNTVSDHINNISDINDMSSFTSGQTMDVDMADNDVQDWLDSLVVPINPKLHPDLSSQCQFKEKKNDTWGHGV